MKWKTKEKRRKSPREDDTRVVRKFLLWPKSIDGVTKWLCMVSIKQTYYVVRSKRIEGCSNIFGTPTYSMGHSWWSNDAWVEDET